MDLFTKAKYLQLFIGITNLGIWAMSFYVRSIIKFHSRKLSDWFRFGSHTCDLISIRSVVMYYSTTRNVYKKAKAVPKNSPRIDTKRRKRYGTSKKEEPLREHKILRIILNETKRNETHSLRIDVRWVWGRILKGNQITTTITIYMAGTIFRYLIKVVSRLWFFGLQTLKLMAFTSVRDLSFSHFLSLGDKILHNKSIHSSRKLWLLQEKKSRQ